MGHKTHPLGFRLGILQHDRSIWYSDTNLYMSLVREDYEIRKLILQSVLSYNATSSGITRITIKRNERKKKYTLKLNRLLPSRLLGNLAFD